MRSMEFLKELKSKQSYNEPLEFCIWDLKAAFFYA